MVSIHWTSITYFTSASAAMSHYLKKFLNYPIKENFEWSNFFFVLNRGARGYRTQYVGPDHIRLYAYPHTGTHCHLEIPGELLESIGTEHLLGYLRSLQSQKFESKLTRLDIAFDQVPFTPMDCSTAWLQGKVKTRANRKSWDWHENVDGKTFYMGSRKSDRFIRVYDRRGPTRLELVLRHERAESTKYCILNSKPTTWIPICVGLVRDFIDFVDSKKTIKNPELLDWWAKFVQDADKISVSLKKVQDSNLERKYKRYYEKLIPTLYLIRHGLGFDINQEVDKSYWRLSPSHEVKLEMLQSRSNYKPSIKSRD